MKKLLIGLLGFLQGVFGTLWGIHGLAFSFPNTEVGSKEYEEDRFFIPLGYIMIMIFLIVMFFNYYKLRKNKLHVIIFTITWLIGAMTYIFLSIQFF